MSVKGKAGSFKNKRSASLRSRRNSSVKSKQCSLDTDEICLIPMEPISTLSVSDIVKNKFWERLNLTNILSLKDTDYLRPFEYTEICVAWIEHHRPDQDSVEIIWNSVPFNKLCDRYIWDIKNHLSDYLKYHVQAKPCKNRRIITYSFTCNPFELKNKRETWNEWHGCGLMDCVHLRNHAVKLQLQNDVPLYHSDKHVNYPPCNKISIRHYHPGAVVHWWGWTDTWRYRQLSNFTLNSEFDSLDDEYCQRTFVSMMTNTLEEFINKINQGGWKYIACMIKLK